MSMQVHMHCWYKLFYAGTPLKSCYDLLKGSKANIETASENFNRSLEVYFKVLETDIFSLSLLLIAFGLPRGTGLLKEFSL